MPIIFTPDNTPRYDSGLLRYIVENFTRLKGLLANVPRETISGTAPADPYTGQGWFDTTNKQLKYWNGTAWTVLGNYEKVDYTPTITQSVSVAATTNYANWQRVGNYVEGEFLLSPTGTGTANQIVRITLPVAPASSAGQTIGYGYVYNGSGNQRIPILGIAITGAAQFIDAARISGNEQIGQNVSNFAEALTSGDSIHMNFRYRVA